MIDLEAIHVAVLEPRQLFQKHHRRGVAVAVQQHATGGGLRLQHGFQDGDHRGDAGAAGERHITRAVACGFRRDEAAHGRQHIDDLPFAQIRIRPHREVPRRHLLDGDADFVFARRHAHRVVPPYVFAVEFGPQREMLSGAEREHLLQRLRNLEADGHGIRRLPPHLGYLELVKSRVDGHSMMPDKTTVMARESGPPSQRASAR